MLSFTYTYKHNGTKITRSLPYDPSREGWKFDKKINCCLHFRKGDLLLRIKTATQMVIMEQEGKNRPVMSSITPIKTQESFITKTKGF